MNPLRSRRPDRTDFALSVEECLNAILDTHLVPAVSSIVPRLLETVVGFEASESEIERALFTWLENDPEAVLGYFPDISSERRLRLLASFELAKRYLEFRSRPKISAQISDPAQAALQKIEGSLRAASYEWLGFVPLHRSGAIGSFCFVEKGVRTHVNTEPAELFAKVLILRPRGFFLFHNHPAGTLEASSSDLNLTQRVSELAHQLGTPMLGHYIVTCDSERLI